MAIMNVRNIIIGIFGLIILGFIASVPSCSSNPCLNGATCMESRSGSGYTCLCPALYTGIDCGTRVLRCSSSPCLNGATCMESNSGPWYVCRCPASYTGRDCGTRDKEKSLSIFDVLIVLAIFGLHCFINKAKMTEKSKEKSLSTFDVLILIAIWGLSCFINKAKKTEKIPSQKQAQSIDLEDTTTKPRQLQEECNIGDDFTRPPKIRPGVYGVRRLVPSHTQAQPIFPEDTTTKPRQLQEECNIGDDFTTPPKIRLGVYGVQRLGVPSRKQAQPRRRVQGPLLNRCGWYNHDDFFRQLEIEIIIRQLQEKIINYRPGEWTLRDVGVNFTRPPTIRLGVFGDQCSGKSTLLNSLHFSLTDTWKEIYAEGQNFGLVGETVFRGFMKLTDYVTTGETRSMFDFSARRLSDVMAEINGNRGIDPNRRHRSEKIDCPIFVFKYSVGTEFLSILIDGTKKRFRAYPILVLTFGDSVADHNHILYALLNTGMPGNNIFFIENYTKDNHEMIEERHIRLLKILEACILRAEDNIAFLWSKEQEIPCWKKVMNAIRKI